MATTNRKRAYKHRNVFVVYDNLNNSEEFVAHTSDVNCIHIGRHSVLARLIFILLKI